MVRRPNLPTKIDNFLWIAVFTTLVLTGLSSATAAEECRSEAECSGEQEIACSFDILFRAALPLHLELNPDSLNRQPSTLEVASLDVMSYAATFEAQSGTAVDILSIAPKTSPPFVAVSFA